MHDWLMGVLAEWEGDPWMKDRYVTLRKLVDSPSCDIVWRSIKKQKGMPQFDENPDLFRDEIFTLAGCIADAIGPQDFSMIATRSQRKIVAKKASAAINIVAECVNKVWPQQILNEQHFSRPMRDAARDYTRAELKNIVEDFENINEADATEYVMELLRMANDERIVRFAESFAEGIASEPQRLLSALCKAFNMWADEIPMIQRPNDPNAGRLRLIRELTRHFLVSYNTPLRAQVLAIASVFFDCDGLSESDIAKLAPCTKLAM